MRESSTKTSRSSVAPRHERELDQDVQKFRGTDFLQTEGKVTRGMHSTVGQRVQHLHLHEHVCHQNFD